MNNNNKANYLKKVLENLMNEESNQYCFDCGKINK